MITETSSISDDTLPNPPHSATKIHFKNSNGSKNKMINTSVEIGSAQMIVEVNESSIVGLSPGIGVGLSEVSSTALVTIKRHNPKKYWDLLHLCFSNSREWLERGGIGLDVVLITAGTIRSGLKQVLNDIKSINSELKLAVTSTAYTVSTVPLYKFY